MALRRAMVLHGRQRKGRSGKFGCYVCPVFVNSPLGATRETREESVDMAVEMVFKKRCNG